VASNECEIRASRCFLVNGAVVTYDLEGKERDRVSTGGAAVSLTRSSTGRLAVIAADNRLAFLDPKVR